MASPGPRTAKGKAIASKNAIQHGIYSNSPVITRFESEEDWNAHLRGFIEDLAPQGSLELMLAERVAVASWRLGRVMRYEREAIATGQEKVDDDLPGLLEDERDRLLDLEKARSNRFLSERDVERSVVDTIDNMFPTTSFDKSVNKGDLLTDFLRRERLLPDEATLNKIMRYEAHLSRQFYQALHELEAMQTRRMGGVAPLARLEVHGSQHEAND